MNNMQKNARRRKARMRSNEKEVSYRHRQRAVLEVKMF
jgi:hypothetical protein